MSIDLIRVQLAEDHEVVRTGFRYLLDNETDIEVVAESASGIEACRDYEKYHPDILVLDISMEKMNGLEAIRRILGNHPDARILVLSMHTGMIAKRALQQGARGFLSKQCAARDLILAIRKVIEVGSYVDTYPLPKSMNLNKDDGVLLSKRELEVCMLLTKGQSVSNISEQLHLSEKTVYSHRTNLFRKLGVATVVELVHVIHILGIHSNYQV